MRYWTIVHPDKHPTLDFDIVRWETLSEKEILDSYWNYWYGKMVERGLTDSATEDNCLFDWCIIHWAERNYWIEMKENIQ